MNFEQLWDSVLNHSTEYELLNNGYTIENCDNGYLYLNKADKTFLEVGYKNGTLIHIAFKAEI